MTPPRRGPGAPMLDGRSPFHAEKAYKDSKLCNLLLAREALRQLQEQGCSLPVLAWSPGLVTPRGRGGFFRDSHQHNPLGQAFFELLARDLLQLSETPQGAGALLAWLATDPRPEGSGSHYWGNRVLRPSLLRFEPGEPSAEARSDSLARELWALSAGWLDLP